MKRLMLSVGETLSCNVYSLYKPLYSVYKAITDRKVRRIMREVVHRGMTVVDVGANIGVYTRYLARLVGPDGRVIAIEPSPVNCMRLRSMVVDLSNVRIISGAASEFSGEMILYVSSIANIDHRTYETDEQREKVMVQAYRLDEVLEEYKHVDFIKMDIQGYELHALRGLENTLRNNPGLNIILEFWPYGLRKAGTDPQELISFLRGHRYELQVVDEDRRSELRDKVHLNNEEMYWNLFAHH